jgi:hypothetical protein
MKNMFIKRFTLAILFLLCMVQVADRFTNVIIPPSVRQRGYTLSDGVYAHRKSVPLSRASGAVTDYQMKLPVSESSIGTQITGCESTTGWTANGASIDAVSGYEGTNCIRITTTGAEGLGYFDFSSQDWSVTRILSFWQKRTVTAQATGSMLVFFSGGTSDYVEYSFNMADDWTKVTINTFTATPTATAGTIDWSSVDRIRFDTDSASTVLYIDDVRRSSHIDCNGHCLSTFNDLRFTNSSDDLLDYWIESISGTTPNQIATVWIEFDSIGTGDTTFYMYYGKADAAAYSNGANTFPFFEDWNADLDTEKWTTPTTYSIADSILSLGAGDTNYLWSQATIDLSAYKIRAKSYVSNYTIGSSPVIAGFSHLQNNNNNTYQAGQAWSGSDAKLLTLKQGVHGTFSDVSNVANNNNPYISEIYKSSTTVYLALIDSAGTAGTVSTATDTDSTNSNYVYFNSRDSLTVYNDWILARKFLAVEPTWGAWGAEE